MAMQLSINANGIQTSIVISSIGFIFTIFVVIELSNKINRMEAE